MNEQKEIQIKEKIEIEQVAESNAREQAPALIHDGEFKVTVRKLEMPVRPRGVLAE